MVVLRISTQPNKLVYLYPYVVISVPPIFNVYRNLPSVTYVSLFSNKHKIAEVY